MRLAALALCFSAALALTCAGAASPEPAPPPPLLPETPAVRIVSITVSGPKYFVAFDENVLGPEAFAAIDDFEAPPVKHVHFYYDTVPESEAGLPGAGPWHGYIGISPLRSYNIADRPEGATSICAIIANEDHTYRPGSGNCVRLPE